MILGTYKNGNYIVTIKYDGTKIRETDEDHFEAEFPESMDVNISNQCNGGCPFCYLGATPNGNQGKFDYPFFNDLPQFMELAININDFNKLPDGFEDWLVRMHKSKIIVNATINQRTLNDQWVEKILDWHKRHLLMAIGVSFSHFNNNLIELLKKLPNTVLHVICGLIKEEDLVKLSNHDLRILFLGYKMVGRGKDFYSQQLEKEISKLEGSISEFIKAFKVCSFDNLAIKQLKMQEKLTPEHWKEAYMGNDGQFSMYVDLVTGTFSKNSLCPVKHEIKDLSLKEMFKIIKEENALYGNDI